MKNKSIIINHAKNDVNDYQRRNYPTPPPPKKERKEERKKLPVASLMTKNLYLSLSFHPSQ